MADEELKPGSTPVMRHNPVTERQAMSDMGQRSVAENTRTGRQESSEQNSPGVVNGVFASEFYGTSGNLSDSVYRGDDGNIYADVVVRDPSTKEPVLLQRVRAGSLQDQGIQRVTPGMTVQVNVPNLRNIGRKDTDGMTVTFISSNFATSNTAIPSDLLRKNRRSVAAAASRRVCSLGGSFNFAAEASTLFNKTSLGIMTNALDPRSAGIANDAGSGDMTIFHKSGSTMSLNGQGVDIDAKRFNTGTSTRYGQELSSGGLPASEHPLRNLYPASNILLNIPIPVIPWLTNIADMLTTIVLVYKIFKLGQLSAEYIKADPASRRTQNTNTIQQSIISDFENSNIGNRTT